MTEIFKKNYIFLLAINFCFIMSLTVPHMGNTETKVNENESSFFGDWQKICNEETKICSIVSFGLNSEGEKKARVSVSLSKSVANGKVAEMTILSPLYSYLPEGMITAIQDNEPIRHEFKLCAKEGCLNFIPLHKSDLDFLRKEWNLVLAYQDYRQPNEKVVLDVSLVGFKKALESLSD